METNNNYNAKHKNVGLETEEILQKLRDGSIFNGTPLEITGPPRTYKSTTAQKIANAIAQNEGKNIVLASRTKVTAKNNYDTYRKRIDPAKISSTTTIQYFGLTEVCPEAEGDYPYARHKLECNRKKNNVPYLGFTNTDWKKNWWEVAYDNGYCPYHLQKPLLEEKLEADKPCVIFTTYSSLPEIVEKTNTNETIFILNEYRHTLQIPILKNQKIDRNSNTDWFETLERWGEKYQELDLSSLSKQNREEIQSLMESFLGRLKLELNLSRCFDNRNQYEAMENQINEFKCDISNEVWKEVIENIHEEPISNIYSLLQIIDRSGEEDTDITFDLIEDSDKNQTGLNLVIRKMNDGSESRKVVQEIMEKSRKAFLVDSTPFSDKLDEFVFGKKIEYETVETGAWFDFTIVIEDAKYTLTDIREDPEKQKRHIEKVEAIKKRIEFTQNTCCIFARSKDEKQMLEDAGIEDITYFRSVESEGTDKDYDYVICTGLPLPNLKSSYYRKNKIESCGDNIYFRSYQETLALMELLQAGYRTAGKGDSGFIMLNGDKELKQSIRNKWEWSKQFPIKIPHVKNKGLDKKTDKMIQSLIDKDVESTIHRLIKRQFQIKPYWKKSELSSQVPKRNQKVIEEIDSMLEEGVLVYDGDCLELVPS